MRAVEDVVVAISVASAFVMWAIVALCYWRMRRAYRAAGSPPIWIASMEARGWWVTGELLNAFSVFTALPPLILNSLWSIVVGGGWFIQMIVYVWVTHPFGGESEGAGP
jgi:L-asparagine transporter-like permease